MAHEAIRDAILLGNPGGALSLDQLALITQVIPSEGEAQQLLAYTESRPLENLSAPERFLHALATIPRLRDKIDAWVFMLRCTDMVADTQRLIHTFQRACHQVRECKPLRAAMAAALQAGNELNYGSTKAGALGFSIETLPKLADHRVTLSAPPAPSPHPTTDVSSGFRTPPLPPPAAAPPATAAAAPAAGATAPGLPPLHQTPYSCRSSSLPSAPGPLSAVTSASSVGAAAAAAHTAALLPGSRSTGAGIPVHAATAGSNPASYGGAGGGTSIVLCTSMTNATGSSTGSRMEGRQVKRAMLQATSLLDVVAVLVMAGGAVQSGTEMCKALDAVAAAARVPLEEIQKSLGGVDEGITTVEKELAFVISEEEAKEAAAAAAEAALLEGEGGSEEGEEEQEEEEEEQEVVEKGGEEGSCGGGEGGEGDGAGADTQGSGKERGGSGEQDGSGEEAEGELLLQSMRGGSDREEAGTPDGSTCAVTCWGPLRSRSGRGKRGGIGGEGEGEKGGRKERVGWRGSARRLGREWEEWGKMERPVVRGKEVGGKKRMGGEREGKKSGKRREGRKGGGGEEGGVRNEKEGEEGLGHEQGGETGSRVGDGNTVPNPSSSAAAPLAAAASAAPAAAIAAAAAAPAAAMPSPAHATAASRDSNTDTNPGEEEAKQYPDGACIASTPTAGIGASFSDNIRAGVKLRSVPPTPRGTGPGGRRSVPPTPRGIGGAGGGRSVPPTPRGVGGAGGGRSVPPTPRTPAVEHSGRLKGSVPPATPGTKSAALPPRPAPASAATSAGSASAVRVGAAAAAAAALPSSVVASAVAVPVPPCESGFEAPPAATAATEATTAATTVAATPALSAAAEPSIAGGAEAASSRAATGAAAGARQQVHRAATTGAAIAPRNQEEQGPARPPLRRATSAYESGPEAEAEGGGAQGEEGGAE
ncbi:unnamed protein product [Closterium sp. NIES-53]